MVPKLSPNPVIWRNPTTNDALTPSCHSLPLSLSSCPSVFSGGWITVRQKLTVCSRVIAGESGRESESAKFCRLQFRLWLQSKRSTPTYSIRGVDSDSVAPHRGAAAFLTPRWAPGNGNGDMTQIRATWHQPCRSMSHQKSGRGAEQEFFCWKLQHGLLQPEH